jgi:nodulation protein A
VSSRTADAHTPTRRGIRWEYWAENDVTKARHQALHRMLTESFPYTAGQFGAARSWAGARPERRVVGLLAGRPVAHAGLLRRFLRIGAAEQLVGEVGLVAVHPEFQGTGVGRLLAEQIRAALVELRVPFGYLNCHSSVLPYYTAVGWQSLAGAVTRHYEPDDELAAVITTAQPLILPISSDSTAPWPAGALIDRDGTEL